MPLSLRALRLLWALTVDSTTFCTISAGIDLRGTGYARQFVEIKEHVVAALQCMLQMELHRHEQFALQRLMEELLNIFDEGKLDNLITRALAASYRLGHVKDEELL